MIAPYNLMRLTRSTKFKFVSAASGALVVGGVRDIYIYDVYSIPGYRFEWFFFVNIYLR